MPYSLVCIKIVYDCFVITRHHSYNDIMYCIADSLQARVLLFLCKDN